MNTSMHAGEVPALHKIVYCSRNLISGDGRTRESEIRQILDRSRRNNSKAGVTGALLFSSEYFAQVLEGPRSEIEQIFERIQRDARHGDVTVLESGPGEARDFGDWSMAYVEPPAGSRLSSEVDDALRQALERSASGSEDVLAFLRTLVLQEA